MLLIDGHNLIPKVPGLSLRNMDDEQRLISLLQDYCAARNRSLEVFFDGALPGFSGPRQYGRVKAHFVRQGRSADDAIRMRLDQLGRNARNATVVSSDRQVQAEARSHGAQAQRSEDFSAELIAIRSASQSAPQKGPAASATPDEFKEFFDLFGGEPQEGPPPPAAPGGKRPNRKRSEQKKL